MNRTSPPTGVQASPVATPGSRGAPAGLGEHAPAPEQLARPLRRQRLLPGRLPLRLGDLAGDLATDAADLALEVADPGLARVLLDDRAQRGVGEAHPGALEAVLGELARDQVALRDVELLVGRVAGELDHLHPVEQRAGDRVEVVRRGDEHHLGEVEREVQVVVAEGVVLRRVEDLEHRARRVAAEVGAHLVDLVDHEHGVARARVAQRADDRPRHRADVGAAVAADLGLVADPADRDPLEAAARAPARSSGRGSSCRRPGVRRSRGSARASPGSASGPPGTRGSGP